MKENTMYLKSFKSNFTFHYQILYQLIIQNLQNIVNEALGKLNQKLFSFHCDIKLQSIFSFLLCFIFQSSTVGAGDVIIIIQDAVQNLS